MYHLHREQDKKALIPRLKRIEGQIRGVRRLIDEDAPCESVAQQFSAARRVLDKAFHSLAGCLIESRLGATGNAPARSRRYSIVCAITERFGGSLRLAQRPEGGLEAKLTLPKAKEVCSN